MKVYVESGVGAHIDNATVAWVFDLEYWGVCGQGHDEASALSALTWAIKNRTLAPEVVERITGDERAFARDRLPAQPGELSTTLEILEAACEQTIRLVQSASAVELDWDDRERRLPAWARWRTLRQMAWHIADTESRYYLPSVGVPSLPRGDDLLDKLNRSHEHVRSALMKLVPNQRCVSPAGDEWTTVKVLRRLAWHERSELIVMRRLLDRARAASTG